MNTNEIYRVTTNDKKYAQWSKKCQGSKKSLIIDHFQSQATKCAMQITARLLYLLLGNSDR